LDYKPKAQTNLESGLLVYHFTTIYHKMYIKVIGCQQRVNEEQQLVIF